MIRNERGAILVVALAVLGWLSVLTGAWLRLVGAERDTARLDGDELVARTLADSGIDRVLAWFADPDSFTEAHTMEPPTACRTAASPAAVFRKRCGGVDGLPGFRAADRTPQFGGTVERPSLLVQWTEAPALLDPPPDVSSDAPAPPAQVRVELRLFAPASPDAVVSVVSRATAGGSTAAVRAELAEGPWRGFQHVVSSADLGINTIPVRVHWGGVTINGALDVRDLLDRLPRRSAIAPVSGLAYAAEPGTDRWAAITASGRILGPATDGTGFLAPFEHLHEEAAVPAIGLWGHDALKAFAKRHGSYFTTKGTGLLYRDDAGPGISPTVVFAASRGLLFIDTLDRTPPRDGNLEVLRAAIDFVETDAYVGAHLTITPGMGRTVGLDAPPAPEDPDGPPVARDVAVAGVHYRGVLVVAGSLAAESRVRVVGALAARRGVRDAGSFEVWYDAALRSGYRSGFPPVVVKPGSRRAVAVEAE